MIAPPYKDIVLSGVETQAVDHMGGFDSNLRCRLLDDISTKSNNKHDIISEYIFSEAIKQNYPTLTLKYSSDLWQTYNGITDFYNYNTHPVLELQNFICSFNGSAHVSRKLLVAILERFGYFNLEYCSKNFLFTTEQIDGHINDYVTDNSFQIYRKFFIGKDSESFFQTIHTFDYTRFDHGRNIYNLENKLTKSFLHIVSETLATSYFPFVTEKFLYSIVTRGLFLAYAQPGWHAHLEKYYGFKRYTKLFDYRFDAIENPVERLVELMSMISKFSVLSSHDWQDLYRIEQDTIEYNYNHYFSGNYLKTTTNT